MGPERTRKRPEQDQARLRERREGDGRWGREGPRPQGLPLVVFPPHQIETYLSGAGRRAEEAPPGSYPDRGAGGAR